MKRNKKQMHLDFRRQVESSKSDGAYIGLLEQRGEFTFDRYSIETKIHDETMTAHGEDTYGVVFVLLRPKKV